MKRDYEKRQELLNIFNKLEELKPHINTNVDNPENIIIFIIQEIEKKLKQFGFNPKQLELSHDLGHMVYDTKTAILLMSDPITKSLITIPDLIIGCVGGSKHDELGLILNTNKEFCKKTLGFTPVTRYKEANKILGHAEASAIFAGELLRDISLKSFGVDDITEQYIKLGIQYGIAAHTNYKKRTVGKYVLEPYLDLWSDRAPIWFVMIVRYCDRADLTGPHYAFRHFSTLWAKIHKHLTTVKDVRQFRNISMGESMIVGGGENDVTMEKHVMMFRDSQSNQSPYGKYDLPGVMIDYREYQKQRITRVLSMLYEKTGKILTRQELFDTIKEASLSDEDEKINTLVKKFFNLPTKNRIPWLKAFAKAKELMENPEFPGERSACASEKNLASVIIYNEAPNRESDSVFFFYKIFYT